MRFKIQIFRLHLHTYKIRYGLATQAHPTKAHDRVDLLRRWKRAVPETEAPEVYGGGFYDRFLAEEPDHPTLALCYGFQMVEHLETEEFDIPVNQVLWADPAEE